MGLIPNAWGLFWPVFLVLLGLSIIAGVYLGPRFNPDGGDNFEVDLQGASEASVKFNYGAGQVNVGPGVPMGKLMVGSSGVAMSHSSHKIGDRLDVSVDAGPSFIPFLGPANSVWNFRLTPDVPISIEVDSGAAGQRFDLQDLNVTRFDLDTGASSTTLILPSRGGTFVDVDAGAASVDIRVPDGISARINIDEGITALEIDESRFPRLHGGFYQSPDFDRAERRAEIKINSGAGRIHIH
jgi:hypothetical protein